MSHADPDEPETEMDHDFLAAWEAKKDEGYQYGNDALENVNFGFVIARDYYKERITERLSSTAPSWGHHVAGVLACIGLDFGSPENTQWSILRSAHQIIRQSDAATMAIIDDVDWPPISMLDPPVQPVAPLVRLSAETEAAGAIIDIMSGNKLDWRARLHESDFLESADWQCALTYARVAIDAFNKASTPT